MSKNRGVVYTKPGEVQFRTSPIPNSRTRKVARSTMA
jgi:hypothetical protein